MIDWHSLFIYNFALLINVLLAFVSAKWFEKFNLIDLLNVILFTLFFGFRLDVGNDYENYRYMFLKLRKGKTIETEALFDWLADIFSFSFDGYVFLIATASFLTFFFLIIALRSKSLLTEGVLLFYISDLIFLVNDQVRQGMAIVLFLYTVKYLINGNFLKYAISLILIGLLVHQSALFLFLLYPIRYVNFGKWFIIISVPVAFALYMSKKLYIIFFAIVVLAPGYDNFLLRTRFLEAEELGSGLGFIFWIMVSVFVLYFAYKNHGTTIYYKLFFVALIAYILTIEFHIFNRLIAYIVYIKVIFISFLIRNEESIYPKIAALVMFGFFQLQVALNLGRHGGFPYSNYLFPGN